MELAMAGVNLNLLNKKLSGYGSGGSGYGGSGSYASGAGAGVSIVSPSGSGVSSVGNAPPTGNGGGTLLGGWANPSNIRKGAALSKLANEARKLEDMKNAGAISTADYRKQRKIINDYTTRIGY